MRPWLQLGLLTASAACSGPEYFVCGGDSDCVQGEEQGICQATGSCSFADEACDSGQRYGSQSVPSLAGECVIDEGTESSGSPKTPNGTDGGTTSEVASTSAGATRSSSGPQPEDTTGSTCPEDWWNCDYATRQRLTVDRELSRPLTDVPLLVVLDPERVDYSAMQNDGEDVRFVNAEGVALPFEFLAWDPGGTSQAWVAVDELASTDAYIWIYYDNPVAQTEPELAMTWSPPFTAVWHLDEDFNDAVPPGDEASPTGTVGFDQGRVAGAADFGSNSARLEVASNEDLTNVFSEGGTLTAWIYPRSWGASNYGRIADKEGTGFGWRLHISGQGELRFAMAWSETETLGWSSAAEVVSLEAWTHVAVTFDASSDTPPVFYVDGVEVPLVAPPDVPSTVPADDAARTLSLGNRATGDRRFDGLLDEVRISNAVRSAEWLALQCDTMRDALLTYGPFESW